MTPDDFTQRRIEAIAKAWHDFKRDRLLRAGGCSSAREDTLDETKDDFRLAAKAIIAADPATGELERLRKRAERRHETASQLAMENAELRHDMDRSQDASTELATENARLREGLEYVIGEDNFIPRMHNEAKKRLVEILSREPAP